MSIQASNLAPTLDLGGIARREIFNKDSVLHLRLQEALPEGSLGRKIADAVVHQIYQKDVIDLFSLMMNSEISFQDMAELRKQDDRGKVGASLWNETEVKKMLAQSFTAILEYLAEKGNLSPQDRPVAEAVFQKIGPAYGIPGYIIFAAPVVEKVTEKPPEEPKKKREAGVRKKREVKEKAASVDENSQEAQAHKAIRKNSPLIDLELPFTRTCVLYSRLSAEFSSGLPKLLIDAALGSQMHSAFLQKDVVDLGRLLRAEKSFQLYPVLQGKLKSADLSIVWDIHVVKSHYKGILGDLLGRLKAEGRLSVDDYRDIDALYQKFKPAILTPHEYVAAFTAAARGKAGDVSPGAAPVPT